MPELGGNWTLWTCTPGRRLRLSTSLTASMLNARSNRPLMLITSLPTVFSSSYGRLLKQAEEVCGLRCRTSSFGDFIWAFNYKKYDEVLLIANSVLFYCSPPGDRGRPELLIQDIIVRMIAILHSDT